MLASAAPLVEGDDVLLGLIEDVTAQATKGVACGPVCNIGQLQNGGGDAYPGSSFAAVNTPKSSSRRSQPPT
ncbi:MAG: hypothetical protein C0524_00675 [Rhodobacter sp.]|nr:hypothetical protein [Rhodobacter sp.]